MIHLNFDLKLDLLLTFSLYSLRSTLYILSHVKGRPKTRKLL